jgi:hypothetical protein
MGHAHSHAHLKNGIRRKLAVDSDLEIDPECLDGKLNGDREETAMGSNVDDRDWYTPAQALKVLEPKFGAATKSFIADKLNDGFLRAEAALAWDSTNSDIGTAWGDRDEIIKTDEADVQRDVVLEKEFWRDSCQWLVDVQLWRWPEGRFVITRRLKPALRTIFEGLRFSREDIDGYLIANKRGGGRPPKYGAWAELVKAIVDIDRSTGIDRQKFSKLADFEKRVLDHVGRLNINSGDRLDDDTMKRCIAMVWGKLIDDSLGEGSSGKN